MLDQQGTEPFIGRSSELAIYQQWLENPDLPWLLYFYDRTEKKGGIGKTWLLRKCAELTSETHQDVAVVMIDFFNVPDRGGVTIATRVAEQLQHVYPEWTPTTFLSLYEKYEQARAIGGEEVATLRGQLSGALTSDLEKLDTYLSQSKRALVLFFDTFELIENEPVIAVLEAGRTFPDTYHFKHIGAVVAGRNPIDWEHPNWRGREQEVKVVPMNPFTRPEMIQYMASRSFSNLEMDMQTISTLYERTEGRPILIGLLVDVLNYQLMRPETLLQVSHAVFEETLVAQINNLENPTNWVILFMAHAYHRFNFTLLDWMLRESQLQSRVHPIKRQSLQETLPTLSFVRQSSTGNDFVLHDEMRRLIIRYCWDVLEPDRSFRRAISRCAIDYYGHELEQISDYNDPLSQTYRVEMLYHQLYIDVDRGLKIFREYFDQAMDSWQRVYARSLLQEVQNLWDQLSLDQQCDLQLSEASLLRREENALAALDLYHKLEQQARPSWLDEHSADIFYGMGYAYLARSDFAQTIDCFNRCVAIDEARGEDSGRRRTAELLGTLGYIHRRQGNLDQAARRYEESIAFHREENNQSDYADTLNNMGNLLRLQGKFDEAQRCCKIGLHIREKLFKQGEAGEVPVGLILSTLGSINLNLDDLRTAEHYYKQAFEIYQRNSYRRGIVATYNRFGQIALVRGDLTTAMQWFKQAEQTSEEVNAEAHINSVNKQGRVLVQQERWQEAISRFEKAVALASEVNDYYQEAESLIDMAEALEQLGRRENSQQVLQKGEEIAQHYHYYLLLGNIKQFRGEVQFRAGRYREAFHLFGESCAAMVRYNPTRFEVAMNSLTERLLELPQAEIPPIVEELRAYWSAQQLDEMHPEMLRTLEMVVF